MRFLALGDSYTVGEMVEPAASWPAQLASALRRDGLKVEGPEVIARTGWTTDELEAGIRSAGPEPPWALVSLLIGVNDQYRGRDVGEYAPAFASLLARAVLLADRRASRVLVLSIPDWGVTPFAAGRDRAKIAAEIDAYNDAARAATVSEGARWVDVTPASREPREGWLAPDELHPSGSQYERWADLARAAARDALAA